MKDISSTEPDRRRPLQAVGARLRATSPSERICAGAVILSALAVSLRWWDTRYLLVPVVQAAYPLLGLAAGLLPLVLALFRRWRAAVVALLIALVPAWLAVASLRSDTVGARAGDETLLVSNLQYGQGDARTVVEQIRRRGVDTAVLTEVTPAESAALRRAGLGDLLPHRTGQVRTGSGGTIIVSRHRLTDRRSPRLYELPGLPQARVEAPGGAYLLRAAHPYPPSNGLREAWYRQLAGLADWREQQDPDVPLVLAGDFNSSQAHPAFRRVAAGMTDAQRATGAGWVRTWPQESRVPPFVALDHVLVRRIAVVDAGSTHIPGTDHAAVWARLRIPG